MKRIAFLRVLVLLTIIKPINAQSEAGAVFLLISPGARAGGMGEHRLLLRMMYMQATGILQV